MVWTTAVSGHDIIVTCLDKVLNSHSSVFGEIGSRFISPEKDTPTSRYQSMDGLNMRHKQFSIITE